MKDYEGCCGLRTRSILLFTLRDSEVALLNKYDVCNNFKRLGMYNYKASFIHTAKKTETVSMTEVFLVHTKLCDK